MVDSRAKGKRAEQDFINRHLRPYWPDAARNIDQYGDDKRDIVRVGGVHYQVKHVERLNIWTALAQAQTEASPHDLPVVAFKRSRSGWYCALEADKLIALVYTWGQP